MIVRRCFSVSAAVFWKSDPVDSDLSKSVFLARERP
jgi:hypothetical protein